MKIKKILNGILEEPKQEGQELKIFKKDQN